MVKTSWPFVEWTETLLSKKDHVKLEVYEEVVIGDDAILNMGALTKVEIFSSCLRPNSISIKGDKVCGILAENREEEYFFHALFEDVRAGEKKILEVLTKGKSTVKTLKEDGYCGNFAWNTPHVQRIVFPRKWKIQSAFPKKYILETFKGRPSIKWVRSGKFWGEIQVKAIRGQKVPYSNA